MTQEQKQELAKTLAGFIRHTAMSDKVTVDFPSLGELGDRLRRAMIAHFAYEIDNLNPNPAEAPPPPAEAPAETTEVAAPDHDRPHNPERT